MSGRASDQSEGEQQELPDPRHWRAARAKTEAEALRAELDAAEASLREDIERVRNELLSWGRGRDQQPEKTDGTP